MLKKKEKLEQMRELGRGGLSKGLHFLQQRAAAASAALENGEAPAAPSAATAGSETSKMSYEELLALSMKLTRQNKLMKSQFQKTQSRLKAAATSDADVALLRSFLETEVGLDVASCQKTETQEQGASIDADALKDRYQILVSLQSQQKSSVETADLLNLSPMEKKYEEVDLLGDGAAATASSSELDEAMKQVERMRLQMQQGAEQTKELERKLSEREQQQEQLKRALEEEKEALQRQLQELQREAAQTNGEETLQIEMQRLQEMKMELEQKVRELSEQVDVRVREREQEKQKAADAVKAAEQEKEELIQKLKQAEQKAAAASTATVEVEAAMQERVKAALEAQRIELETEKAEKVRLQEQLKSLQEDASAASGASKHDVEDAAQATEALREEISRLKQTLEEKQSDCEALRKEMATLKEQQVQNTQEVATIEVETPDTALMEELERVKLELAEHVHQVKELQKKLRTAEEKLSKGNSESEATQSLVDALKEDTSRLADQVAQYELKEAAVEKEISALTEAKRELEEQQEKDRESRAAMEKQLVEERAYWTSKLENLITDGDSANSKVTTLEAELREKEKQVTKMAASQTSMTEELMELQKQLSGMREDLAMAAEGLEAHATKAETNERRYIQSEKEVADLKNQLDEMREKHHENFEMLRCEKESELDRVQKERRALMAEKKELAKEKDDLEARCQLLERNLAAVRKHEAELETNLTEQVSQVGNLSVDLAETKKALSDRMAHATRLQTENMGMAGKLAEQVALIEGALRDASNSKAAQKEMEAQVQAAKADAQRMKQSQEKAQQELENVQRQMQEQQNAFEAEREEAKQALRAAVENERLGFKREVGRLETDSKHKSKLALQAVLEKEKEIARLSTRLNEVEEDVRSGDADNRKILEFAQLQAKREAEQREQEGQMQELNERLEDAQKELQELREDKRRHAEELTAMLQNQRRDGVNMEYLKNVVVQYMSFRPGSSQQARLVPVLTTLLQFTAADIKEIKHAARRGNSWTSWGSSDSGFDYKPIVVGAGHRHPMAPPSTTATGQADNERRSPLGRKTSAPAPRVSPPSESPPTSSRASSFFLPNGNEEPADPSAESADF